VPVHRFGGAWAWGALFLALDAWGQTAVEPVRIEYTGAPGCGGQREIAQEILARTRRARLASAGERARVFRLAALPKADRVVGRLEIVGLDGTTSLREVTGKTCGEVLEALTLVARIAIDPVEARDTGDSREARIADDSERASPGTGSDLPPSDGTPEQENAQTDRAADTVDGSREPGVSSRFRLGLGAHAFATTLVSPSVAPGFGVFADWAGEPPAWLGLRAALRLAASGETETGAGAARFLLMSGRFGACVPRLRLSNRWTVCPIAGMEAGVLNGRGAETSGARSANRPWLAVGAGLRLEWRITSELFAELEGEGSAPVVRDRFVFDEPETTVHEPAAVGANAAIGLGYRFR
jgi:hypothetical protein